MYDDDDDDNDDDADEDVEVVSREPAGKYERPAGKKKADSVRPGELKTRAPAALWASM